MSKISVKIQDSGIIFSNISDDSNIQYLNSVDNIDINNVVFSESYLLSNNEIIHNFFEKIAEKNSIVRIYINNKEIALTILKVIKSINQIKEVVFSNDDILDYSICFELLKNSNLEYIECYNIPEVMYDRFKNNILNTRDELLFISNFMKLNNISTSSDIYNKINIKIPLYITLDDINDLEYFLDINKSLKIIEFHNYWLNDIKIVLDLLKKKNLNNISIYIYENKNNTKQILSDIESFSSFTKEYNIIIEIKYSKEYREKNRLKQLNINMIKWIVLAVAFISIIMVGLSYYHQKSDLKNQQTNQDKIKDIITKPVDEVQIIDIDESNEEEIYKNPYQLTYENQMIKLLEVNTDTIGWLNVKNTSVDYPVVQTTDNDYYLNNAFDKTRNQLGWIFADYRNKLDETDKNIIIYGHRVKNTNLMFTTLKNVLEENWYQNSDNLDITFNMKENLITWRIFSIYTIEKTNDYIKTDFKDNNDFLDFAMMLKNRSIVDFNEQITEDDQILTLSTCYLDSNHRLVIHAKRTK